MAVSVTGRVFAYCSFATCVFILLLASLRVADYSIHSLKTREPQLCLSSFLHLWIRKKVPLLLSMVSASLVVCCC